MSYVEFNSGMGDGVDYYAQYAYLPVLSGVEGPDRNLLSRTDLYREDDWGNLLQVTRGYEPRRDLLTNVTTVAMPATAPAPVSRFDYQNDAVGRRAKRILGIRVTSSHITNRA